ncbi:MAG: thioredoxin domain-containing protein [Clostridia bacterium]|nr:thioredoxin domain-containing protein [Clostridia bacterium]
MLEIEKGITELYDTINNNEFVFMEITAPWCNQCKMMKPVIQNIEDEYKDKVIFVKIDQDKNPEISSIYNVISLPTFFFFVQGEKKEAFQMRSKSFIQNLINKYIGGGKND